MPSSKTSSSSPSSNNNNENNSNSINDVGPTLDECQVMASSLMSADELPLKCRQMYPQLIRTILERRNSATKVDPFQGMWTGSALSARAARAQGKEHQAQIQRRMTSTRR